MTSSAWMDVVRSWPLIAATVMAAWSPAIASAGQNAHANATQRMEDLEASRDAEEQANVKQDKSLLRAIEKTKHLRKDAGGNVPHVWPSPECFPGVSWGNSPGLIIKESGYGTAVEPGAVTTWQHDRHGNVTFRERLSFDRVNGITHSDTEECAYDDTPGDLRLGKLVYKISRSSRFGPGNVYHITYNARGQVDVETEDIVKRDGTLDYRIFTRFVYDAAGRLLQQVFDVDYPLDGTIDYQSALVIAYNEQGQFTRIVLGYYDVPGGTFTPYRTNEYTRDADTEYRDYDGDGVADQWSKTWRYYDEQDRVVRILFEYDDYRGRADGIIDSRRLYQLEYDSDGNIVRSTYETVGPERFSLPFREETRSTYNDRGWLMQQVYIDDVFIDGLHDQIDTSTFTRDQHGKVTDWLRVHTTRNVNFKHSVRETFEYNGIGNMIESSYGSWFNDDPPRITSRVVYEYAAGRSAQEGSGKD